MNDRQFRSSVVWQTARSRKLSLNPICERCSTKNKIRKAEEVDHIIPLAKGGDRLKQSNLQSLCKMCHLEKSRKEKANARKKRFDKYCVHNLPLDEEAGGWRCPECT